MRARILMLNSSDSLSVADSSNEQNVSYLAAFPMVLYIIGLGLGDEKDITVRYVSWRGCAGIGRPWGRGTVGGSKGRRRRRGRMHCIAATRVTVGGTVGGTGETLTRH